MQSDAGRKVRIRVPETEGFLWTNLRDRLRLKSVRWVRTSSVGTEVSKLKRLWGETFGARVWKDYRELLSDISSSFSFPLCLLKHINYLSIYQSIDPSIDPSIHLSISIYYPRVSSKMLYVRFPISRTPRSATALPTPAANAIQSP